MIGRSGNTGNSSGPHLHFEYWRNGKKVDPRPFLSAARSGGQLDQGGTYGDARAGGTSKPGAQAPGEPAPGVDLFGTEQFYDDMAQVYGGFGAQLPENQVGGNYTWAEQLQEFQQNLANQGVIQNPRKTQARSLMQRTVQGMSNMVKRDGYQSAFPTTGDQEVENVVERKEG